MFLQVLISVAASFAEFGNWGSGYYILEVILHYIFSKYLSSEAGVYWNWLWLENGLYEKCLFYETGVFEISLWSQVLKHVT